MSLSYDTPDSAADVINAIDSNTSITSGTNGAISTILNLSDPTTTVVVGSLAPTGQITSPTGYSPQMIIFTGPSTGSPVIFSAPFLINAPIWIFDGTNNISCSFGNLAGTADNEGPIDRVIQMGSGNDEVSVVDNGNTTIDGALGNDVLILSGGDDSITGGGGNDSISAGLGDDTIVSGVGLDTVDGGLGFDVLQLEGSFDQWTTDVDGRVVVLTGAPGSGNGVEMTGINFISFGTPVDINGNQTSIVLTTATDNKGSAMRLYQAALDRSADQSGAQYWLDEIETDTINFVNMAASFLVSDEYVDAYGTQTNTQFVEQIYQNTFDRAADQAGLNYWLNSLDSGTSRALVLASIAASEEASNSVTNVIIVTGFL
jgi:Domain of unknown function (DUF4214)/RTX calcium-binding nonapeptide repeat (4 copies)